MYLKSFFVVLISILIISCKPANEQIIEDGMNTTNTNMPFTVISSGQHSNYTEGAELVLTSNTDLDKVLKVMNANREPNLKLPKIDFKTSMLFFYATKERSYGGPNIKIKNVEKTNTEILVYPKDENRDPLQPVLTVMTTPYILISIKKSDLPVRFVSKK